MPNLSADGLAVAPSLAAGLVFAALPILDGLGLPRPTATAVACALGVSRQRAYALQARVETAVAGLLQQPGRPCKPPPDEDPDHSHVLTREVLRYLMSHPGAVRRGEARTAYSDGFRLFVLELLERQVDLGLRVCAVALEIPLATLEDWLAGGRSDIDPHAGPVNVATVGDPATEPRIASVLHAFAHWHGGFRAFCTHVQHHLRIPFTISQIRDLLQAEGKRIPKRRGRVSAEEHALRGQFETFFPGAQWVGDGTPLDVWLDGVPYTSNLELLVDPASGAFVGMSLRDSEDGQAVVEAFEDALSTTGASPEALLLDNRPSNHTDEVVDALGDTIKLRATVRRPQNKAHVEGAFGLFAQTAPQLCLNTLDPQILARKVLDLVVTTWARTLNHRPRSDRTKHSRVALYQAAAPTEAEREAARKALLERHVRQETARKTRRARLDPVLRAHMDRAFGRLGLDDPDGHFRAALAVFPHRAITAGLAIFAAKKRADTLPDGVDARYLLGIVRRVRDEDEGMAIAEALWEERERFRDTAFAHLHEVHDRLEHDADDLLDLLRRLTDHALATSRQYDRVFWLRALADMIRSEPDADHRRLFLIAARRIHGTHAVPYDVRNVIVRRLAAHLRPIE